MLIQLRTTRMTFLFTIKLNECMYNENELLGPRHEQFFFHTNKLKF